MTNSMRVKVINSFLSPLDSRLLEVEKELHVPKNQFWYKRAQQGDIKILKENIEKKKAKSQTKVDANATKNKKGSK